MTKDDEVCIPSHSSIFLAVIQNYQDFWVPWNPRAVIMYPVSKKLSPSYLFEKLNESEILPWESKFNSKSLGTFRGLRIPPKNDWERTLFGSTAQLYVQLFYRPHFGT